MTEHDYENEEGRAILERQIAELESQIASLKTKLINLLKEKSVAEFVTLRKQAKETKGFTFSVPLFDFLMNIKGTINAFKIYDNHQAILRASFSTAQTPPDVTKELAYIANAKNYEGVNASTLNVVMLFVGMNADGKDIEQWEAEQPDWGAFDAEEQQIEGMYRAVYCEDLIADEGMMGFGMSYAVSLILGIVFYLIGIIVLLVGMVKGLVNALIGIKQRDKACKRIIEGSGTLLTGMIFLLAAMSLPGGSLSGTGIALLVISLVLASFNGVAVRLGKRSKEENAWLNFRQGEGVAVTVGALIVVLLLQSADVFSFWNQGMLFLLKSGIAFEMATTLFAMASTLVMFAVFTSYGFMIGNYSRKVACLPEQKSVKGEVKATPMAEAVSVVVFLVLLLIPVALLGIFGDWFIAALVIVPILAVVMIVCAKFMGDLEKKLPVGRVEELKTLASQYEEAPQAEASAESAAV